MEKRAKSDGLDYIFVDTPGQIEVFSWSASGQIISESLASSFPTVMLFCVDTPRCAAPTTFMSNMLYACSVLYRSQLPLVCAFNKNDIISADVMIEWMRDFEKFQDAIDGEEGEDGYLGSLNRSLCLVLDEFYKTLSAVPVSATSGDGFDDLAAAIGQARAQFCDDYVEVMTARLQKAEEDRRRKAEQSMERLQRDLGNAEQGVGAAAAGAAADAEKR